MIGSKRTLSHFLDTRTRSSSLINNPRILDFAKLKPSMMSLSLYQVVTLRLHQECEIVDPRPHIHRRVIGYPDSGT